MSDELIEALAELGKKIDANTEQLALVNTGRDAAVEAAKKASERAEAGGTKATTKAKETAAKEPEGPSADDVANVLKEYASDNADEQKARKVKVKELLAKVKVEKHSDISAENRGHFIKAVKKLIEAGNVLKPSADADEDADPFA